MPRGTETVVRSRWSPLDTAPGDVAGTHNGLRPSRPLPLSGDPPDPLGPASIWILTGASEKVSLSAVRVQPGR